MDTALSTETFVRFYQIASHHTPADSNLHIQCCEKLKSHIYCASEAMIQLTPRVMAYTQKYYFVLLGIVTNIDKSAEM
jgi:hypothetical protein